ncbi:MAG: YdcF family protein [Clostridia bacterium]|nr:YdcF family protein [Clostridia bacterium]
MKTIKKIIDITALVCAGIVVLNYTVYLAHLIVFPEQPLAFVITFAALALTVLPIVFRKKLKSLLKKAFPVLKGIWTVGLVFYAVTFLAMVVFIFSGASADAAPEELPDETVIIVYGAKVGGTEESPTPGRFLQFRLDRTAEIMNAAPKTVCIVCGGKGKDEPAAEAMVMKDYLVKKGIAPERIFVDDASANTIENIENAVKIIDEEGFGDYKIACLSTEYHIPRIKYLCDRANLEVDYYFHAPSPNFFGLWSGLVREYMSYGKLLLTGHL